MSKRLLVKGDPNDVVIIRSMIEMGVFNFVSGGWYWALGWKHRDYRHALYPYLFHPIKYLRAKFFVTVLIMYVSFVNISFGKCPGHIKSLSTRHNLWRYFQCKKCIFIINTVPTLAKYTSHVWHLCMTRPAMLCSAHRTRRAVLDSSALWQTTEFNRHVLCFVAFLYHFIW